MRALMCHSYGAPDTLTLEDLPSPQPGAGEVRVKVAAAGVNFPDTLIIQNKYQIKPQLPFAPGAEISGVVDAIGAGVTSFKVGDPVVSVIGYGGFADEVVVPAKGLLLRPTSMDAVTAAGFGMTYGTSMHALKQRAKLEANETLLILGAAGGVGLAAVEIGVAMGARVIAAASSDEKLEFARRAGAHDLINYKAGGLRERLKEVTRGEGVDVVYDPVGGDLLEEALRSTAWGGRVLVVGFASGVIPKVPVNLALLKGCSIVGVFFSAFRGRSPQLNQENFDQLFSWHAQGKLSPLISQTVPLARASEALLTLEGRGAIGKIVVEMGQSG